MNLTDLTIENFDTHTSFVKKAPGLALLEELEKIHNYNQSRIKRDFGIACSLLKNYDLKNVVWIDSSTNSSFGAKELGITTSEKEIIPIRFGESNLSLNQGGVLYAQQQTNLYLVSLKSLQFWEKIWRSDKFSDKC